MNILFPHEKNKPLSKLSTFGIGGPAAFYTEAKTADEMEERLLFANHHSLPVFILGKGSNCLFDDAGFDGLVIQNRIDYLKQEENVFIAGAGYSFARLGSITARLGFKGLEFASGIPATVGGAVYMNAGANGQQTSDTLVEITYLNEAGELERLKGCNLAFQYRHSPFQGRRGAIIEASFQLKKAEEAKAYQKKILEYRLHTQPYSDKSAGCVFRNPQNEPAGKLIEQCGLKGAKVGDAEVSQLHANFIVNRGNATAKDVRHLIQKIKETVYREKDILLVEEILTLTPYGISS